MKNIIKKLFSWFFQEKENEENVLKTGNNIPDVTLEEAYVPHRSEMFDNYLLSKGVNLEDPIDASVKIRRNFKSTPDTAFLKGNVDIKRSVKIKAATNVVIANLRDFKVIHPF